MDDLEASIAQIIDQTQATLFENPELSITDDILTIPLGAESFPEKLLSGEFSEDGATSLNRKELILKKILGDVVSGTGENSVQKACLLLDLCYHLKCRSEDETESKMWASLFFDLTATCILTLPFPHELGNFYLYLNSRLPWYLEGLSKEPVPVGETNLKMGIRPPAAKLFFSIDTLLKNLNSHSLFLTPAHFDLVHRLLWWISQLIPINDNCNINKRAKIMEDYPESFWAPHLPALGSSATILSDWVSICDDWFLHPLHWVFSHPRDKLSIEPILHRFLDEVLSFESDFYKMVKNKKEKNAKQQAAVNGKEYYSLNFINGDFGKIKDSRDSISESKVDFWKYFNSVAEKNENVIQLLPLELDLFDLKAFQDRIEAFEYGYFRKLVIIQIFLTVSLFHEIISDSTLAHYCGKIFNQTVTTHSTKMRVEYGDNTLNKNEEPLKFLSAKKHRILTFYQTNDTPFYELLKSIVNNEVETLKQKVGDYADMKDIHWSSAALSKPVINDSFKKFGWIKLGNKKLDSLWKVPSGLELAKKFSESNRKNPSELYKSIVSGYKENSELENNDSVNVKQWQTLRSLRSEYLFEFNKVSEKTTLNGFADETLVTKDIESKKEILANRAQKKKNIHAQAVAEAEQYFKDIEQKRRDLLEAKIKSQREALESSKTENTSSADTGTENKTDAPKRELEGEPSESQQDSSPKKRKINPETSPETPEVATDDAEPTKVPETTDNSDAVENSEAPEAAASQ
ncbi:THO complex subunit HPR1 [Kluyveromyces marxianus]